MEQLIKTISAASHPLQALEDLDKLMEFIGDANIVLMGESTHGSKEFYEWRAWASKRLIEEKGFDFIAVEGDWPDCYKINQYVKGYTSGETAQEVLKTFRRWPTWMWANGEVEKFMKWLREENRRKLPEKKVGFYGLDIYSLWESLNVVSKYLKKQEPKLIKVVQHAYECFEPYHKSAKSYASTIASLPKKSCEKVVTKLLQDIRTKSDGYENDKESFFDAEQNALIVKNAEEYYRTMLRGDDHSWNIREKHMADTFDRLLRYHGKHSKAIIWAHNTHVGDARATSMKHRKILSLGQLVRKKHEKKGVVLIGLSAYQGETIAGETWESPMKKMPIPPSRSDSWEFAFHRAFGMNRMLLFQEREKKSKWLREPRFQRAIGVVYDPEMETRNYVKTSLTERYDALLFIDRATALNPIAVGEFQQLEIPETYPSAL